MKSHYTLVFLLVIVVACQSSDDHDGEKLPNIIFIMSDDHGYQAVSAYGYGLNNTPNIDRLAREGAIFHRATVTNSICAPSRAVILTGKHSFINGKVDNVQAFDWEQENFAKLLQRAGYTTAMIGKIHLDGLPQGFDYSMVLPGQGHYYNPDFLVNGERKRFNGHVSEITTASALRWLKEDSDKSKPFLLIYNQKAPHRNWKPASKYLTLFDDTTFMPPASFFDQETNYAGRGRAAREQEMEIDGHAQWGHDFKLVVDPYGDSTGFDNQLKRMTPEQRAEWEAAYGPKNEAFLERFSRRGEKPFSNKEAREIAIWKYNRYLKDYLRTVQSIDDGVGEVLDYLDEAGLTENTVVVYTSDQGFYLGEHGWFDKRFMYEESFRTPLLIRYPAEIKPGTTVRQLVQNLDYAPTLLDFAKQPIPSEMQGLSFRPLLNGDSTNWRDAVYYTYYEYPSVHMVKRHYGIATERYKLMHFYYDIDEWELYDLERDPNELRNVYNDPAYETVRAELHKRLDELRSFYGDSDSLDTYYLNAYLEHMKK